MKEIEVIVKMPESQYYTIKDFAVTHSDQLIANGMPLPDWINKFLGTEEKTGRWIKCDVLQEFKCSKCRMCFRNKSNYCPNCGAKMENCQMIS